VANPERWQRFRELPAGVERRLERLVPLLEREGVQLAYLFGSLARGKPANDVDLAVLVKDGPAFRLQELICDLLETQRLDLVDLRAAPPVLRFEILRTGRLLYAADGQEQERYEMETIHLDRDTHYLRRQQWEYLREKYASWSFDERQSNNA
jgi:predicted nucleotidyltransferase